LEKSSEPQVDSPGNSSTIRTRKGGPEEGGRGYFILARVVSLRRTKQGQRVDQTIRAAVDGYRKERWIEANRGKVAFLTSRLRYEENRSFGVGSRGSGVGGYTAGHGEKIADRGNVRRRKTSPFAKDVQRKAAWRGRGGKEF